MSYKVLVDMPIPEEMMQELHDRGCETTIRVPKGTTPGISEIEGFYVYGHGLVDGAVMDQMPKLRVISNMGVGVDHIVIADARARGIPVGNTPGFVDGATADMAFLLLMAVARNLQLGVDYARSPEFLHFDPSILHGSEVHGQTLGILGMGAIGSEVAQRAGGFNMKVLYHNRNRADADREKALKATYVSKAELLAKSDFVLLSTPMTPETSRFMGYAEFKAMQPTAFVVNIARGGLVDHDGLLQALNENQIAGAALDVTEPEPLPRDHLLVHHDRVIITPHLGSASRQTRAGMSKRSIDNLMASLAGDPLLNEVLT